MLVVSICITEARALSNDKSISRTKFVIKLSCSLADICILISGPVKKLAGFTVDAKLGFLLVDILVSGFLVVEVVVVVDVVLVVVVVAIVGIRLDELTTLDPSTSTSPVGWFLVFECLSSDCIFFDSSLGA